MFTRDYGTCPKHANHSQLNKQHRWGDLHNHLNKHENFHSGIEQDIHTSSKNDEAKWLWTLFGFPNYLALTNSPPTRTGVPPTNGEYQHWLQPMALIGWTNSKSGPCWHESFTGGGLQGCTSKCGWAITRGFISFPLRSGWREKVSK